MKSYENEISDQIDTNQEIEEKLDYSILEYMWKASPLSSSSSSNIPKFLRKIKVLKNFSDYELKTLSNYLHIRNFTSKEVIFNQEDVGVGFYFILSGQVEIWAKSYKVDSNNNLVDDEKQPSISSGINHIATLERMDHFGELALLQENSVRTASAVAKESCTLLGIFKPDMDELINAYPVVGAKLLQSISIILANRLSSITTDVKILKFKLHQYENDEFKSPYQK